MMPKCTLLKELSILLTVAVLTAFTVNFFSPAGIALVGQWDVSYGVVHAKSKNRPVYHQFEIEDIRIAKKIFDGRHAVFVDARSCDLYDEEHIRGAVSLPVQTFDEGIDDFLSEYPTSTPIIVYCSGRQCDEAHHLSQVLMDLGYERVTVFIDGFQGWQRMGYPTAAGRHQESRE